MSQISKVKKRELKRMNRNIPVEIHKTLNLAQKYRDQSWAPHFFSIPELRHFAR